LELFPLTRLKILKKDLFMKETSPEHSRVEMTQIVLPQHTNALGTIFGGVVLSWVDIAAAICAQKHCKKTVVTASIDAMNFLAPIHLGWIVYIKAKVNYTSRTSCEVGIEVSAENPQSSEYHHTATAYVTMVAIDSYARPTAIPALTPQTEEEKKIFEEAKLRRETRLKNIPRPNRRHSDF
jgi:acyl-CoA hydrolase